MLGANLASVGALALVAAEPTPAFDVKSLGPALPYVIGGVFTVGVILVGLILSRKSSASAFDGEEELGEELKPDIYVAPNPLWKVVVPGLAVVALGVIGYFVIVPLFEDMSEARQNFRQTMQSQQEAAIKAVLNQNAQFQAMQPAFQMQQNFQLPPTPHINMPVIQPQIKIPQVYVDSHGIVRTR